MLLEHSAAVSLTLSPSTEEESSTKDTLKSLKDMKSLDAEAVVGK